MVILWILLALTVPINWFCGKSSLDFTGCLSQELLKQSSQPFVNGWTLRNWKSMVIHYAHSSHCCAFESLIHKEKSMESRLVLNEATRPLGQYCLFRLTVVFQVLGNCPPAHHIPSEKFNWSCWGLQLGPSPFWTCCITELLPFPKHVSIPGLLLLGCDTGNSNSCICSK